MIGRYMIVVLERILEGCGRGVIGVISQNLLGGTEENHRISVDEV
jgi:hypothetical protein